MLKFVLPAVVLALSACTAPVSLPQGPAGPVATQSSTPAQRADAEAIKLVQSAFAQIKAKEPAKALVLANDAISYFEESYRQAGTRAYSARTHSEGLVYVLESAQAKTSAKSYAQAWGAAYYLKAYALIDLQRVPEAKVALDAAIDLAPRNAQYLAERGHIEALEHNWPASLATFQKALDAVEFSPPEVKLTETTRALRGLAFAKVELKDLDAAEALHKRVLQMDPTDVISPKEIQYIRGLRARSSASGARQS
jgi:tetratricopeptide (TPR) repeat protein